MVDAVGHYSEVVLFYAKQSLVLQVADWVRKHPQLSLRLVSTSAKVDFDTEMQSAAMVIIDATEIPGRAIDALESAVERLGRPRVAVYTEQNHPGLKRWVEMRGAPMLVGPLSHLKWDAFFSPETVVPARPVAARKAKRVSSEPTPLPSTYINDRLRAVAMRDEMAHGYAAAQW